MHYTYWEHAYCRHLRYGYCHRQIEHPGPHDWLHSWPHVQRGLRMPLCTSSWCVQHMNCCYTMSVCPSLHKGVSRACHLSGVPGMQPMHHTMHPLMFACMQPLYFALSSYAKWFTARCILWHVQVYLTSMSTSLHPLPDSITLHTHSHTHRWWWL